MLIDSDDDPISLSCENTSLIEENNLEISNTIDHVEPITKKRKIIRKDSPKIVNRTLTFLEYYRTDIDLKSYKIVDLKAVASHNRLHISGNKTTLITRIFTYFQKNMSALKIQSNLRRFFVKRSFQLRGPAYHDRSICVNDTDFFSLEPLTEIPFQEFFSYKDEQSFVYGFNVCSLMSLLVRKGRSILNPYNRAKIPEKVIGDMIRLYVYSIIFFPEHVNEEDKCVRTRNLYIQSPNPTLIARGYYYGFQCSESYHNSLLRNRTNTVIPVPNSVANDDPPSQGTGGARNQHSLQQPIWQVNSRRRVGTFPRIFVNSDEEEETRIGAMIDNILDVQNVETITNTESSDEWMNRILNSPTTNLWLNEMLATSRNSLPVGWDRNTTDDTTLTNSEDISGSAVWFVNPIIQAQRMRVNTHIRFTDEDVPPFEDELPENPLRYIQNMDEDVDDLQRRLDQHSQVATSGQQPLVSTSGQQPLVATSGQQLLVATSGQQPLVATSGQQLLVATSGQQPLVATSDRRSPVFGQRDEVLQQLTRQVTSLPNEFGRTQNPVPSPYVPPTVPTESSEEIMHIQTMENRMREIVQQPILVRTQELFMEIDQLGNYTNVEWFHQLSKRDCFVFFEYMYNHWRYRGQLSSTVKKRICPLGDPFLGITNIRMRMNEITEEQLRFNCITVMERLAYTAYDIEDRKLAVLYILAALTQVSLPARNNMLWLYESLHI